MIIMQMNFRPVADGPRDDAVGALTQEIAGEQPLALVAPERNMFLRALLPNMGFPYAVLTYSLGQRFAGKPAYTFGKLLSLAVDAIFSFSILPIRTLFAAGLLIAAGSFVYGIIEIYNRLFTTMNPPGFTDIVASVLFLGGLNLVMLAVIGKYTQVILEQVKQRPEYIIDPLKSDYHDSSDGR